MDEGWEGERHTQNSRVPLGTLSSSLSFIFFMGSSNSDQKFGYSQRSRISVPILNLRANRSSSGKTK